MRSSLFAHRCPMNLSCHWRKKILQRNLNSFYEKYYFTFDKQARAWQIAVRIVEERTAPLPVDRPGAAASVLLALEGTLSENLLTVDEVAERLRRKIR